MRPRSIRLPSLPSEYLLQLILWQLTPCIFKIVLPYMQAPEQYGLVLRFELYII